MIMKRDIPSLILFALAIPLSLRAEEFSQADIVLKGANWSYFLGTDDPGTDWAQRGFDDSSWETGPGPIGYGDSGLGTTIPSPPPPRPITLYGRHEFEVDQTMLNQSSSLRFFLQRDDGAAVYLNGTELIRSNLPDGVLTMDTLALAVAGGAEEFQYFEYVVSSESLVQGTNVLAVEAHQDNRGSSDTRFDIALKSSFGISDFGEARPPIFEEFESSADRLGPRHDRLAGGLGHTDAAEVDHGVVRFRSGVGLKLESAALVVPQDYVSDIIDLRNHSEITLAFDFQAIGVRSSNYLRARALWSADGIVFQEMTDVLRIPDTLSPLAELVSGNSAMRYLIPDGPGDLTDETGKEWSDPGFDDSEWSNGSQAIGYASATSPILPFIGANVESEMKGLKGSAFVRIEFDVPDASEVVAARLLMNIDDGALAYLNGIEVLRNNMPTGPPVWNGLAPMVNNLPLEYTLTEFLDPPRDNVLVDGSNVLAYQIANYSLSSSLFGRATVAAIQPGGVPDRWSDIDIGAAAPPLQVQSWSVAVPEGMRFMRLVLDRSGLSASGQMTLDNLRIDGTERLPDPVYIDIPRELEIMAPLDGEVEILIPVTLNRADEDDLMIDYATLAIPGETAMDVDFVPITSTLVIPSGQTSANIPITILPDSGIEDAKRLSVRIVRVSKGYPTSGQTVIRIVPPGVISPDPPEIEAFSANPSPEGFLLQWATNGASQVFLAQVGEVPSDGELSVRPYGRATYELVARNGNGDSHSFVTVEPVVKDMLPSSILPGFAHQVHLWRETIDGRGGQEVYRFAVPSSEHLDVSVTPGPYLRAGLEVFSAGNVLLAAINANRTGESLRARVTLGAGDEVLTVKVSGLETTRGPFALRLLTNATLEAEGDATGVNDLSQSAELLNGAFQSLGGTAEALILEGKLQEGDTDTFAVDLAAGESLGMGLEELGGVEKSISLWNSQGLLIADGDGLKAFGERSLAFQNGMVPSRFTLVVTGSAGEYRLNLSRGAFLGRGRNDRSTSIRGLSRARYAILGYTGQMPATSPIPMVEIGLSGDFDTGSVIASQQVASMVMGWDVSFFQSLGDQLYDVSNSEKFLSSVGTGYGPFVLGRSDSSQGVFTSPLQRYFPALGNHDSGGYASAINHGNAPIFLNQLVDDPLRLRLPEGSGDISNSDVFYDYEWGPVHVFVLNSDHILSPLTPDSADLQRQWLRAALSQSRSPWNFVATHHPPYGSGGHGPAPEMQWDFAGYGADAVFSGHNHNFEHYQVDGADCFVSGLGGRGRYASYPVPDQLFGFDAEDGATRIEATEDSARIAFYSINDGANGTNGGRVVYERTLEKRLGSGDEFPIFANAGDNLAITTTTQFNGLPLSAGINSLDPEVILFSPTGQIVANDHDSAPDGRNALLSHTAIETGTYRLRVRAEGGTYGSYAVEVIGASGSESGSFYVESLTHSGADVEVKFSDYVRLDTVEPMDLVHDGSAAISTVVVNPRTIRFQGLHNPGGAGSATTMAAGSCTSLTGEPLAAFEGVSYASWASTSFAPETPASENEAEADPNHDGIANLIHFATNTDPMGATSQQVLRLEATPEGGLVLRFRTWSLAAVTVTVETSDSLALLGWQNWNGPIVRHEDGQYFDWEIDFSQANAEMPALSAFRLRVR